MNELTYILNKYQLKSQPSPYEIPNVTRHDLAKLFDELGYRVGVEIGTEKGKYAKVLCQSIPDLHLHCVDPWYRYAKNDGYHDDLNQTGFDECYLETRRRLEGYHVTYHRKLSMEAVTKFEDNSVDFVYIDGNHRLEYVINDIAGWVEKVRPGGIVSGHDFYKYKDQCYSHVIQAVEAYTSSYKIKPWFVLGRKDKVDGETREAIRSWFFVKV